MNGSGCAGNSCGAFTATTALITMPGIRRGNLPPALLAHLVDRREKWSITCDQVAALADWLETDPEVPTENGSKAFPVSRFAAKGI